MERSDSVLWQKPLPPQKIQKETGKHTNAIKNLANTTIADRLRTISWSNDSYKNGMVNTVHGIPTFSLTQNLRN